MNNKEIDKIASAFNIRDIKTSYRQIPETYDYFNDYNYPITSRITARTEIEYQLTVDEKFLWMLDGYIKFVEARNDIYDYHPRGLFDFFQELNNAYNKNSKEKYLQNKYPELLEIQKDYEIMKTLVVDKNDL